MKAQKHVVFMYFLHSVLLIPPIYHNGKESIKLTQRSYLLKLYMYIDSVLFLWLESDFVSRKPTRITLSLWPPDEDCSPAVEASASIDTHSRRKGTQLIDRVYSTEARIRRETRVNLVCPARDKAGVEAWEHKDLASFPGSTLQLFSTRCNKKLGGGGGGGGAWERG